ncbi:dihydroxyacetone kinase DhaKLM complex PTS-EIIA-like component DhaM [Mycoplasma testudineum]|uniref:Dihydroxyacetone kinase DhaKLM complex PTS-EIIA-like component DhaM n=1 Tax=Mycoplasma testudineum TaxID=244584 RepID=A0A4R6IEX3_9MOLU|nr:hypothetical protein [Mycoplasma testudineum]OYD26629.1 hypothetical protein CG473_03280 [Mycoplasma testudineum]TDO19465.1 dihydroxyacetone kinase DhaKLM complex PTS-EIIA-like component DhaM [Mycoplasma testudineum]
MKLILISHHYNLVESIKEYIINMLPGIKADDIINASGLEDNSLGTDLEKISGFIQEIDSKIVLLPDIGSSVMQAEIAKEMFRDKEILVVKNAFLESAFAISAIMDDDITFEEILSKLQNVISK